MAAAAYRLGPGRPLRSVGRRHVAVQVHHASEILNARVARGKGNGIAGQVCGIRHRRRARQRRRSRCMREVRLPRLAMLHVDFD